MSTHDQLALLPARLHVCPACGGAEPGPYQLQANHGTAVHGQLYGYRLGEHPVYGGYCMRQVLRANHVAYTREHGSAADLAARIALARDAGLSDHDIGENV